MIKKLIVLMAGSISISFAWEVNTHYAINKTALENIQETANLQHFVDDANLRERSYDDEEFTGYGRTYFEYIEYPTLGEKNGVSSWNLSFNGYHYDSLIEAGTILEDVVWANSVDLSNSWGSPFTGNGRFNYHFLDPQNSGAGLSVFPYLANTNAVNWAYNSGAAFATNRYSVINSIEYMEKAFTSSSDALRQTNEALMFVSLGHQLHLLNDMNVPAHTRDDSHPNGDPFEVFMRTIGYRVNANGIISSLTISNLPATKHANFKAFYEVAADNTGKNFYSEDSISVDGLLFKGTFGGYSDYSPRESDVTIPVENGIDYVTDSMGNKLCSVRTTRLYNALGDELNPKQVFSMQFDNDITVLKENGDRLISKAIANSKGYINYFFRGRIEVERSAEYGKFTIKNISDDSLVAENAADFNGGSLNIYYDDDNGERKLLREIPLSNIAVNDRSDEIDLTSDLENNTNIDFSKPLTLVYKGTIGTEEGIAATQLGICANASSFYFSYNVKIEEGNEKFVYYSNILEEMGAIIEIDLYALTPDNEIFTKFTPECYQNFFFATLFDIQGEKEHSILLHSREDNQTYYYPLVDDKVLNDTGNYYTFIPDKNLFIDGEYHARLKINLDKYTNRRMSPTKMMITDVYFITDDANYIQPNDMNITFAYARFYSDTNYNNQSSFDHPNTYQLYCDTALYNPDDFNITGAPIDNIWFPLALNPNLDFDEVSASVDSIDVTKLNSTSIHVETHGYGGNYVITYNLKHYLRLFL